MKELDFIEIINKNKNVEFSGDDCAYLKDFDIVVSQDNFVENVHFKREWATPYQIGYKACTINISDILASGGKPEYITVGLSLPSDTNEEFINELYKGIESGLCGAKIIGGDITGCDKIFISITAIGSAKGRKISSRSNAKPEYVVITTGKYGLSSKGLNELLDGKKISENIKAHLEPILNPYFSEQISTKIKTDYAMMDTSDGLSDALFKIAKASNVTIEADYIEGMFGAEDYNLVACVPKEFLSEMSDYYIIGKVLKFKGHFLKIDNKKYSNYDELGLYDHFKGE
ncbi:MAG: AIR synthase related protein [bacterium]|nr:AIR synthase related protein [bacterium]